MKHLLIIAALSIPNSHSPALVDCAIEAHTQQPVRVADETMRRLRRLGYHFDKSRIERPYDGVGEIC